MSLQTPADGSIAEPQTAVQGGGRGRGMAPLRGMVANRGVATRGRGTGRSSSLSQTEKTSRACRTSRWRRTAREHPKGPEGRAIQGQRSGRADIIWRIGLWRRGRFYQSVWIG